MVTAWCVQTVAGTLYWKDDLILFGRAVEVSPDSPTAHFDYGSSLGARGRLEEALVEYQRATELAPGYADAWSLMGRTEEQLGRRELALEHCRRGVELNPEDARLVNDLGMIQARAGQYADAAESFQKVLELRPRHGYARFNLAIALYQLKDFEGAIRELDMLPNKDVDFPNAWFFLAECQMRVGRKAEASAAAMRFLSLHTEDDALAAQARKIAGTIEP